MDSPILLAFFSVVGLDFSKSLAKKTNKTLQVDPAVPTKTSGRCDWIRDEKNMRFSIFLMLLNTFIETIRFMIWKKTRKIMPQKKIIFSIFYIHIL